MDFLRCVVERVTYQNAENGCQVRETVFGSGV